MVESHASQEKEAAMAPHPFTTIDPNVEPGWFAVPCPSVTLQCQADPYFSSRGGTEWRGGGLGGTAW